MLKVDLTTVTAGAWLTLADLTPTETGPVLVVAPHPDDETLGCGGAIAHLQPQREVRVLVISDGTGSHPRSRQYPPSALQALRAQETISGLAHLGLPATAVTFLALPDGAVPLPGTTNGEAAQGRCQDYLASIRPSVVLLPWRYDPHPDHRASAQLILAALAQLKLQPRILEYPIWEFDPQQRGQLPVLEQFQPWRLDIRAVLPQKLKAIAAYRSQLTDLIADDPTGFRLTAEMVAHFTQPWEVYLEAASTRDRAVSHASPL